MYANRGLRGKIVHLLKNIGQPDENFLIWASRNLPGSTVFGNDYKGYCYQILQMLHARYEITRHETRGWVGGNYAKHFQCVINVVLHLLQQTILR